MLSPLSSKKMRSNFDTPAAALPPPVGLLENSREFMRIHGEFMDTHKFMHPLAGRPLGKRPLGHPLINMWVQASARKTSWTPINHHVGPGFSPDGKSFKSRLLRLQASRRAEAHPHMNARRSLNVLNRRTPSSARTIPDGATLVDADKARRRHGSWRSDDRRSLVNVQENWSRNVCGCPRMSPRMS